MSQFLEKKKIFFFLDESREILFDTKKKNLE